VKTGTMIHFQGEQTPETGTLESFTIFGVRVYVQGTTQYVVYLSVSTVSGNSSSLGSLSIFHSFSHIIYCNIGGRVYGFVLQLSIYWQFHRIFTRHSQSHSHGKSFGIQFGIHYIRKHYKHWHTTSIWHQRF
jgi:hypothetical protein